MGPLSSGPAQEALGREIDRAIRMRVRLKRTDDTGKQPVEELICLKLPLVCVYYCSNFITREVETLICF